MTFVILSHIEIYNIRHPIYHKMCDNYTKKTIFVDPNHKFFFKRMYTFLHNEKFCDMEIIGKHERHVVHGIVLGAFSEFIENISNRIRNSRNRIEVLLNNIDDDGIKKIIEYCYTGKIELNFEDALNMINIAELLQIHFIFEILQDLAKTHINTHNCFNILQLAKTYSFNDLIDISNDYIKQYFTEVSSTREFLNIDHKQLLEFLKYDDLNVSLEIVILGCVKRWLLHDFEKRKNYLTSLLEWVKLPFLSSTILFDEIQPLCAQSASCSNLLVETLKWQIISNSKPQSESFRTKPRLPGNIILLVGDWVENVSSTVLMYDPIKKIWSTFANIDTKLRNFDAIIYGDELIIFGGFIDSVYQKKVESYNMKTDKKSELPEMMDARNHPCVAVINGIIYVAGGYDGKSILKTAECYDPKSRTWKYIESMPTARDKAASVVYENEFFILGGHDRNSVFNIVEAFCPATGKWRTCRPTIVERSYPAATVANGFIYIVGGSKSLAGRVLTNSAERYDPILNTWTLIASINEPRYGFGLSTIGNNLIIFGGNNEKTITSITEEYDVTTDTWKQSNSNHRRVHSNLLSLPRSYIKRLKPNLL